LADVRQLLREREGLTYVLTVVRLAASPAAAAGVCISAGTIRLQRCVLRSGSGCLRGC